jgi:hypothetical protein
MSDVPTVFKGEVQLAGWSVTHNQGAKVTLWVADEADLDTFKTMTARKASQAGQRLYAVFVLLGDDEQPEAVEKPEPKRKTGLSESAGRICQTDLFQRWVFQDIGRSLTPDITPDEREQVAANYVRRACRVQSRSEIDTDERASRTFSGIMSRYREWVNGVGVDG